MTTKSPMNSIRGFLKNKINDKDTKIIVSFTNWQNKRIYVNCYFKNKNWEQLKELTIFINLRDNMVYLGKSYNIDSYIEIAEDFIKHIKEIKQDIILFQTPSFIKAIEQIVNEDNILIHFTKWKNRLYINIYKKQPEDVNFEIMNFYIKYDLTSRLNLVHDKYLKEGLKVKDYINIMAFEIFEYFVQYQQENRNYLGGF
jgi:hypothetical protein